MERIENILNKLDVPEEYFELYGKYKAKINCSYLDKIADRKRGKLVLVTATTPTPTGEGKTTQSIGISMALNNIGKSSIVCLREPSLGPVFGIKGGAIGGGKCIVCPSQDINLHFNGDFHAITSANNLLCAVIDNHIFQGNLLNIDKDNILIKRVIDINDRSLRNITVSNNNEKTKYDTGFELTVASELMAICALALSKEDLRNRIDKMIVALDMQKNPIYAKQLKVTSAMMALLENVLNPNVVQTSDATPAFVHMGPFANIAHGCSSLVATKMALNLSEYVVTEAGFGADLGAEKFFNIKCRIGNMCPDVVVLVTTIKSLKYNGGASLEDIHLENLEYLKNGIVNLDTHVKNLVKFGVPVIVCLNKFETDTNQEIDYVSNYVKELGVEFEVSTAYEDGSKGTLNIANDIVRCTECKKSNLNFTYSTNESVNEKILKIAREIYGAEDVEFSDLALEKINNIEKLNLGSYPVCIAKTPVSFTDNSKLIGVTRNFNITINDIKINNGAGIIVAYAGNILTMPGLSKKSNYEKF